MHICVSIDLYNQMKKASWIPAIKFEEIIILNVKTSRDDDVFMTYEVSISAFSAVEFINDSHVGKPEKIPTSS